jgi:peroxiredoxin
VKYKASGLELVAISLDDEAKEIPSFIKSTGVKFPVGWDGAKKVPPCFDIGKMPTAYIVDRKGVVRFIHRGFRPNEEKDIEKEIKELL